MNDYAEQSPAMSGESMQHNFGMTSSFSGFKAESDAAPSVGDGCALLTDLTLDHGQTSGIVQATAVWLW